MSDELHSFYDDFERRGVWWLPANPERRFPGLLSHGVNANRVAFFGTDADIPAGLSRPGLQQPWSAQIVLGQLDNGTACTPHEVHEQAGPITSSGFHQSMVETEWLLLGAHFETPEAIRFKSLRLNFTSLDEWMWTRPLVALDEVRQEGHLRALRATCEIRLPTYVSVPAIGADVTFGYDISSHDDIASHTFRRQPWISLSFGTDCGLTKCFDHMRQCQDFLTLFAGGPVALTHFVACVGSAGDGKKVQIFFPRAFDPLRESISRVHLLLPMRAIENRLSEIVPTWFAKWTELRESVSLFFSTFYNQETFIESQFLSLSQALEVYSRVTAEGKYLTEAEYEAARQALVRAIPANPSSDSQVSRDFRTSMSNRLRWGNEFSLRKRVKNLLASLEPDTVALVCANPSKYVKRLADTRNYLTHYGTDPTAKPWPMDALVYGSQSIKTLLTILPLIYSWTARTSGSCRAIRAVQSTNWRKPPPFARRELRPSFLPARWLSAGAVRCLERGTVGQRHREAL